MSAFGWLRTTLLSSRTYMRQIYLLIGSALVVGFAIVDFGVVGSMLSANVSMPVLLAVAVPIVVVPPVLLGLVSAVRQVEGVAAESLLGVGFVDGSPGPATTWPQRRRTSAWFLLHLVAGLIVGVALAIVVPLGLAAIVRPLTSDRSGIWWYVPAGVGMLIGAVAVCLALGAAVTALAPRLLGPSVEDRFHALERRAARLSERTRLARELHDSVGHALSLVVVQAGAARKVRNTDPAFVDGALAAVEAAARTALTDLDQVLGLMRDEESADAGEHRPVADLAQLESLVIATRRAELDVSLTVEGEIGRMPAVVSRESYRIVQEALTNALRHGESPVAIRMSIQTEALAIEVDNPVSPARSSRRAGRGLRGIQERAAVLGGDMTAGVVDDVWQLRVRLPLPREETR
ncbi:MAG TPA: histidine kinase [Nocardioidaceae bacterium]|nr:histidine kinase [Nocardioidaceae bacterium]